MDRQWFFERAVFDQDYVDFLILAGTIPVYRDPSHPKEHATMVMHSNNVSAVWAHPSMPLAEIRAIAAVSAL